KTDLDLEDRKETERYQHVVKHRDYGSRAIRPFKPERDVDQNSYQSGKRNRDRLVSQLCTRNRADRVSADDFVGGIWISVEFQIRSRFRAEGVQSIPNLRPAVLPFNERNFNKDRIGSVCDRLNSCVA